MTLCIARRLRDGSIELASDSRITLNREREKYFDSGIKVLALSATIQFPIPEGEDFDERGYKASMTFGLTIAGSPLHSYLVKESVGETLRNLAIIPYQTSINLENICRIIHESFDRLAADIDQATEDSWGTSFLFAGRCPDTQTYRAFRFDIGRSQYGMGTSYREVLTDNRIEFIGSGTKAARAIHERYPDWYTTWIVDQVIRDGSDRLVGGNVQFGRFDGSFDFYVSAIPRYKKLENGEWEKGIYMRGVPVYQQLERPEDFLHLPPIADHFQPERIEKWNRYHAGQEFNLY